MIYIDKNFNAPGGYSIIDELFTTSWNVDEHRYIGLDYNGLNVQAYRNRLLALMMQEQGGVCCYCMKIINNDRYTTIEHIIPQNIDYGSFEMYLNAYAYDNRVIFKGDFNITNRLIPPVQYPHDIAYHNLIASCDSSSHCNNRRGNSYIVPFMYYNDIVNRVSFQDDGTIYCDESEIDDSLRRYLFLNEDWLKLLRKMWLLISHDYELDYILNVTDQNEKRLIIEGYRCELSEMQQRKIQTLTTAKGWNDLLSYKWFHGFFSQLQS